MLGIGTGAERRVYVADPSSHAVYVFALSKPEAGEFDEDDALDDQSGARGGGGGESPSMREL